MRPTRIQVLGLLLGLTAVGSTNPAQARDTAAEGWRFTLHGAGELLPGGGKLRDGRGFGVGAGYSVLSLGRSDKPTQREDYTYARHMGWMRAWLEAVDLKQITLVCQDWGGLIGLRLLVEQPERFARCVAANTMLPTGDVHPGRAFEAWKEFSQNTPNLHVGGIVNGGCTTDLSAEIIAAYDAPFPDDTYKAGARQFPLLVPVTPDDPEAPANREAMQKLMALELPFLTAFSDQDPIMRGLDKVLQQIVPGAKGQPHTTIVGGGHFLQEDQGPALAEAVDGFVRA